MAAFAVRKRSIAALTTTVLLALVAVRSLDLWWLRVQTISAAEATGPIDATNNEAERTLRNPAQARQTGRTSKTSAGARRTSILASVLESLRLYVPRYRLSSVLAEIQRWQETGRSCFQALLEKLRIAPPEHSVLDRVLPQPSG